MSDDLVKRLREYGDDPQDVSLGEWAEWSHKCADRIEELEAENHLLKTSGIVEVAVRNPSVMEYMQHWEGRAEAAEAKIAKAVEIAEEALNFNSEGDDWHSINDIIATLKGQDDE